MRTALLARIRGGVSPIVVGMPGPGVEVTDVLASVRIGSTDEAVVAWDGGAATVRVDRKTRDMLAERSEGLFVADLSSTEGRGFLVPFQPPRRVTLVHSLPVRVREDAVPKLELARLRIGDDLRRSGSLRVNGGTVAFIGQRTIAALDDRDARSVTWWLPDGSAVELRVEREGDRAWLELWDILAPRDAAAANSGPTVIVDLGKDATLRLRPPEDDATCGLDELAVFRPGRPPTFDAWARYAELARESRAERERQRMERPLLFSEVRPRGGEWVAQVRVAPEDVAAWTGSDARADRPSQVGQPVVVEGTESRFTLKSLRKVNLAVAEIVLSPSRGTTSLPESGVLLAETDRGEKVRADRERAALDRLTAGRAACPRLPAVLASPDTATAPVLRPIAPSKGRLLDAYQRHAVEMIVGCRDLVSIQGPPGTGKSEVIVEALRQIAALPRPDGRSPRVLISSVQNEAVHNVIERIGTNGDMLIRLVRRAARDEDESVEFAERTRATRDSVVKALQERLSGNDVSGRLERVRESESRVNAVRAALLTEDVRSGRLAARLEEVADTDDALVTSILRDEARRLVDQLRAGDVPSPTVDLEHPPQTPEELIAWWPGARAGWPAASLAALDAAMLGLTSALSTVDPRLRGRLVDRRWADVRTLLEAAPRMARDEPQIPADPRSLVEAWVASAQRSLEAARGEIAATPAAIADRFLRALKEDVGAWQRILERHSSTVAATCSKAAEAALEPGDVFDWVIIDEAGRASPFELLVPMVQGERVVLIGDHRQLPPMVDDGLLRKVEASAEGTAVDLRFSTLFQEVHELLPRACQTRLAIQYRMHGAIGDLVDRLFYQPHGESIQSWYSGDRAEERTSRLGVFGNAPLVWCDVRSPTRCGEVNAAEVEVVVRILEQYAAASTPDGHVSVIVPYQQQRVRIGDALNSRPELRRIARFVTIDAVQGRDYAVVVLCTTRTDGSPGFLASTNRMNVAISRAKEQLVVVGARSVMLSSQRIGTLAPHLRELAKVVPLAEVGS